MDNESALFQEARSSFVIPGTILQERALVGR